MFSSHGNFSVKTDESIITINLSGSFNLESIVELVEEVEASVSALDNKRFAILLNALDTEGFTPEAYEKLDVYNAWLNEQNLVAKAIVSISPTLQQTSHLLIPARKPQRMKRFTDVVTARTWLTTVLQNS